jgi:hypothetical protein
MLAALAPLVLVACDGPKANTDDPQYKLGYQAGHDDGADEEKTDLCRQIEDYKDSIAEALKEADICPQ